MTNCELCDEPTETPISVVLKYPEDGKEVRALICETCGDDLLVSLGKPNNRSAKPKPESIEQPTEPKEQSS